MRLSIFILTLVVMTLSLGMLSACNWGMHGQDVRASVTFYTGTEQGNIVIVNERFNQVQRINAPPEVHKEGYTLIGWFQASTLRGAHAAREGVHALTTGSEAEFPFDLQGRNLAFGFFASWKPNGSVITEEGFVLKPGIIRTTTEKEYWVFIGLIPSVHPARGLPIFADTYFEFPTEYLGIPIRKIARYDVQGLHSGIGTAGYTFVKIPRTIKKIDIDDFFQWRAARMFIFVECEEMELSTSRPENIFTDWDEFISHPRFPKNYFVLA